MISLSHVTPHYIYSRLAIIFYEIRNTEHPWLTADAIRIMSELIRPNDIGVEFGSGRSTIWLAYRLKKLTSIEHNTEWYERISKRLFLLQFKSTVDYRLCKSSDEYIQQVKSFDDESLDFCLVDGHNSEVRGYCALSILPKIKKGGVIVVDNINRFLPNDSTCSPNSRRSHEGCFNATWTQFAEEVSSFRRIYTTNSVFDTAIWIKY